MKNRIYRNQENRVLGGVCAGLGEFLGIDPIFIRIFFVFWVILGELAVLAYLVLWLVIPPKSADEEGYPKDFRTRFRMIVQEIGDAARQPSAELITYTGAGLIAWGVFQLLRRLGAGWFIWDYKYYLWPVLLIIAGAFVLYRSIRNRS